MPRDPPLHRSRSTQEINWHQGGEGNFAGDWRRGRPVDGRPPTDIKKQLLLVPRKTKMRPLFLLFLLFLGFSRVRNGNLQYFTTSYSAFEATHVAIVECAAAAICIEITTSPLPNPDTHVAAHPPSIRERALRSVLPPCYLSIDSSSPPPPPPSPPRTNLSHVFAVQSIAVQTLLSLPISEREKKMGGGFLFLFWTRRRTPNRNIF